MRRRKSTLWAERFDKERRDILEVQEEIVARLSRSVGFEMVRNEADRPSLADGRTWTYAESVGPLQTCLRCGPGPRGAGRASATSDAQFGHVGNGITSWWLCYRLISDSLAVFLRHSFGGVYSDHDASLGIINPIVEQVEKLIALSGAARRTERIAPERRVVLAIDDLGGSSWEIAGGSDGWRDSNQPINDVMALLAGDQPPRESQAGSRCLIRQPSGRRSSGIRAKNSPGARAETDRSTSR